MGRKTSTGTRKRNGVTERPYRTIPKETELSSPQDYFTCVSPAPRGDSHAPSFTLPLKSPPTTPKSSDPDDLSVCSDLESGVADLSSHASSACDDTKDPDSDEAVYANA